MGWGCGGVMGHKMRKRGEIWVGQSRAGLKGHEAVQRNTIVGEAQQASSACAVGCPHCLICCFRHMCSWLSPLTAPAGCPACPSHPPVGRYFATRRAVAPPRVSTTTRLACTLCAVRTCRQGRAGRGGAGGGRGGQQQRQEGTSIAGLLETDTGTRLPSPRLGSPHDMHSSAAGSACYCGSRWFSTVQG